MNTHETNKESEVDCASTCYAKPVRAEVVNLGCPVWNVTDADNKIILRVIPSNNEELAKAVADAINLA